MKRSAILIIVIIGMVCPVPGQHRPFPQNIDYPFGVKPATISTSLAESEYIRWKNRYLVPCDTVYRVTTTNAIQTLSEGTGYGMILTAYFGEKDYFDGLLAFYKRKLTANAKYLMAWDVTCEGFNDMNCATDGDLDVAHSLLVAYNQWGGKYLREAITILSRIKKDFILSCGDTLFVLRPGAGWGGCHLTDISYYTPSYFRLFAEVTGDSIWKGLVRDTYRILEAGAHPVTGLVPDWQSADGVPGGDPPSGRIGYYRYDASRVPWRIGLDYLWNGDTLARNWCTKVTNWSGGIGPANIVDGYDLDGGVRGQYHNSAFVGGFTIGAMCNEKTLVDDFATELSSLNDGHYFNLSVRCLYLLTATGNFWKPELDFVPVDSIIIKGQNSTDSITIPDGTLQMEARVLPDSAWSKSVSWIVINGTGVAEISESGLLHAIANGTVTVVALADDMSGVSGETEITLSNQTPLVEEIRVTPETGFFSIVIPGGSLQMIAEILPDYALDKTVSWSITSGSEYAIISETGLLTALANGDVVVLATANDGSQITGQTTIYIRNQNLNRNHIPGSAIIFYPNPANNFVYINPESSVKKIELVGINGKVLTTVKNNSGYYISINTSDLIGGIYFLNIYTGDGSIYRRKFIKQ